MVKSCVLLFWACLVIGLVLASHVLGAPKADLFDFYADSDELDLEDVPLTPEEEAEEALFASFSPDDDEFMEILNNEDEAVLTGRQTTVDIIQQLKDLRDRRLREAEKPKEELQRVQGQQELKEEVAAKEAEVSAADAKKAEAVVALTAKSLDEALQKYPYAFIEFYAPWCGHCKKLAPELEDAARQLAGQPGVLVAKVDCTVEEVLGRRFDVRGYPTMKFFRHGKYLQDYELGRTAAELVAFIKKKSVPITVALNTVEEVNDFMAAHPTSLIVYAEPNSDALLGVRDTANQAVVEGFAFGEVSDPELIVKLGEQVDTVKVYRSFAPDEPHVLRNPTPASILGAVLAYGFPYVNNGPEAWDRVMSRKVPIIILFVDMEGEGVQNTLDWFTEVAKENIHRFSFLYAGKDFHSRLPTLGASGDIIPTIVAVDAETTKSWPFDESKDLNRENVEALLSGIADRTLRPHYTSERPPEDNSGDVLVVVGDTFEELVLNNDKDVLIEFYAPWCGHCKQMAPTWEKVGQHFAQDPDIVVAKIDASANDNPAVVVAGYPTIFLFPAGNKSNPIEYKGLTRHFDDFVAFVEDNATAFQDTGDWHADGHDHDDL